MSSAVAPFLQLPNDALLEVLARSNPLPPFTIARTCRHFFSLLQNDAAWGVLHQRDFRTLEKAEGKTTFLASYQTLHRIFSNVLKGVYLNDFISSESRPLRRGLHPPYLTIGQDRLFRGGSGHSIEIWDLKTAQPVNLYGDGMPLDVWHVLPDREELVVDDAGTAKVLIYDLKTLSSREFEGPKNCNVICVHEGKLIGGHTNGSIEIWDLEAGTFDQELTGLASSVKVLAMVDGLFISGSVGNHFKVWDWEKKECLFDFRTNQFLQVFSYCTFNHLFILGYGQGGIHAMKINVAEKKMEKVFQLDGVTDPSFATGTLGGIPMLLTTGEDDLVCFWDLDTGACMKAYSMKDDCPGSIAFYDGKLLCSNIDGTIIRYDFAADDLAILEDIAVEFERGDQETAALRFSKMPHSLKMKIYDQIAMGLDFCDGGMDGERPSHEEIWKDSPRKAEALRNYVRVKRQEEKKEKV